MSEFFLDSATVRVEFPDGQWIEVKPELTQEDEDYIMSQPGAKGGLLPPMLVLERSIVSWSFDREVSKESISQLKRRYRAKVSAEVVRLNTEALEFVEKN